MKQSGSDKHSEGYSKPGSTSNRLRQTPLPKSVQQILLEGERAARLLNDDLLNVAVSSALAEIQDLIIQTSPEEKNKREGLYQETQALFRLLQRLQVMLNEAQHQNEQLRAAEQSAQQAQNAAQMGL